MKEVYLLIQDLCPEGQALSDTLLVAYGLALTQSLCPPSASLVSPQKGACTLVWHPHFCSCHQGNMVWLWWPMGLMLTIPLDCNQQKNNS